MEPREVLEQALREHGISDLARLESHIRGCNLALPVAKQVLSAGENFDVWVRDGGTPGKYGLPPGEPPASLGIIVQGRHRECYRVLESLVVVRCTAASFPLGLVERVGGMGGGIQYLLPPDWLGRVEQTLCN